ncbi:MAG: isoleucine--tRNA ligase [Christensenellales bacterium]|jgi:isoleucyl-tRNA synthetase
MKYGKMDSKPDIPSIQQEVLEYWRENNTFEKSVSNKKGGEKVFYDGPPFPTGKPHHGTVLVSFIKDMIARYWTMRGYSVPRVWGWDCHGLPIETQAEAALGIKDKNEIESSLGVDKFNKACFNIVSQNDDAWREYVEQMARWVDYDGAYKTMSLNYMESVLWTFKQCYEKGLIYQDYRVTPYCYRCETSLSISDTRESDSTRPKQDPWIMVKFKTRQEMDGKPVYFLAWTTTPWTLPSNLALAVGAELNYAYVQAGEEVFVLVKSALQRYEKIFGKDPVILKTCKGSDLIGERYTPIFDYFAGQAGKGAFRVIAADFVFEDEGLGIVHIAPAFGEDDYWACKAAGIPLVNPVDAKGKFTRDIQEFEGRNVIDANRDIIRLLKSRNQVVGDGTLEHNYPHCWRCRTPLIYKAMEAWYFSIDKIKEQLLARNQEISWIPETVKNGRFGNWLANARDWNISRNRYWSTPIPIWECSECKKRRVLGSIDEIYEVSGIKLTDLHKQYMDEVTFPCSCGGTMRRIPEVLDCWFETGCVPHAQKHYPFENKDWFESHFPCDFVVEYTGQIRCWFYYLHVIAVALFDKPAFQNCVVHGTVLAKDGKKLSKSSKNYTDPMELMKKYGTDAFRLYMYQSAAMLMGDLLFDESGLQNALQQIILPLWNSCSFYTSYANLDNFSPESVEEPDSDNRLDKWILAKLYDCARTITESMDNYQVDKFVEPIVSLLDGLTNWYIRRSRRRFWGSGLPKDKKDAYQTMLYVLVNTCKLLAPVAPVVSEKLYQLLTGEESVHLADWPNIPERYQDKQLLEEQDLIQSVIHLARSIRTKNNVKLRQPLGVMQVVFSDKSNNEIIENAKQIIAEELNVKEIEILEHTEDIATVDYLPNFSVLAPKYGKDAGAIIKAIKGKQYTVRGERLQIELNGEKRTLDEEDTLISYLAKPGLHVMSKSGIITSLDLTITEELMREGIAREVVRNIQDTRKQIGCDISDRILIKFSGQQPPAEWISYIENETLGTVSDFEGEGEKVEIAIGEGETLTAFIKKSNE